VQIKKRFTFYYVAFHLVFSLTATAATSAYLPLKQSASIERKVDNLLLLANMTSLKKPIAINQVKIALTKVCPIQKNLLCTEIKNHLKKYETSVSLTDAKIAVQISDRDDATLANQRGIEYQSNYYGHATSFSRINDYFSFSAGIQMNEDDVTWENTYLSVGSDWLQLDIGTKPHWISPMENSAMLLSTHAATIPTLSISNSSPLSDYNINYELFVGELSESDNIYYQSEYITGKPIITGLHFSFSPWEGFSLGVNRLMQSGGGERGGYSFSDLVNAFFDPSGTDNIRPELSTDEQFGNQAASLTSQFTFQGEIPFSLYFEYAGEDTSRSSNYRLGNVALSTGLYIPELTESLGLRLEISEWQNSWYVHSVYKDGLTNNGNIIGNWAAESRYSENGLPGDGVGAFNIMAKVYWALQNTDEVTLTTNIIQNEEYTQYDYDTSYQFKLDWLTTINNHPLQTSFEYGKNIFNESYFLISSSLSW
jgi:hypothetical protein